jgi:hypothetical protein
VTLQSWIHRVRRLVVIAAVAAAAGALGAGWRSTTVLDAQTPSVRTQIEQAFSLAGHWTVTRLDVSLVSLTTDPSSVPSALVGAVNAEIRSALGSGATFDVDPGGAIHGSGHAQYLMQVTAGSASIGGGSNFGALGVGFSVPVGASATLDEPGTRSFTISGQADERARALSLNAFQPAGGPLSVMIRPGGGHLSVPVWPAMTNVDASVVVEGASLVARAAGVVGGKFRCAFEAVKYVDLGPLFDALAAAPGADTGALQNQVRGIDDRVKQLESHLHDSTLTLGGASISMATANGQPALLIDAPANVEIRSTGDLNLKGAKVMANGQNIVR